MNIAHRGFSAAYPENTLLSFRKALALGVTQLELDLQLSFDGHLIVMHDGSVDRTTNGSGNVSDLNLSEIKELDTGSWVGPEFEGLKVPTYQEVLTELDGEPTLVTELKFAGNDGIRPVLEMVENEGATNQVVISSFDLDKLTVVRQLAPDMPTTALLKTDDASARERVDRVLALGADTIGPRCSDTTQELVDVAHEAGLRVRAWGLGRDQGEEMTRLLDLGVDGMTTDCPDILQTILEARE